MKKDVLKTILSFIAVVLWAVVIFGFSSQSGSVSSNTSGSVIRIVAEIFNPSFDKISISEQAEIIKAWQNVVRKGAHFFEYAVLGVLLANAFYRITAGVKKWLFPIFTCLIYAVSDELHQFFVPKRSCSLKDVFLDTFGGMVGVAIFLSVAYLIKKVKQKKKQKLQI